MSNRASMILWAVLAFVLLTPLVFIVVGKGALLLAAFLASVAMVICLIYVFTPGYRVRSANVLSVGLVIFSVFDAVLIVLAGVKYLL